MILLAMLVIASVSASAQVYLGGSFGFNREFDENKTEFTILPEIGYNFNDAWAIGGQLGYTHTYNDGVSVNLGIVNPYARWTYFRSSNNIVSLFLDGGVDLGFGAAKVKDGDTSDTAFTYGIGIKPGISINPNEKFSIIAHLGGLGYYSGNDTAKDSGAVTPTFGLNFSTMNLNLGFVYNF